MSRAASRDSSVDFADVADALLSSYRFADGCGTISGMGNKDAHRREVKKKKKEKPKAPVISTYTPSVVVPRPKS
jgi:hypothetical protein